MVEVKIRTGEFGKIANDIDVKIDGSPVDVLSTMVELEHAITHIIECVEKQSKLKIRQAFLENLTDALMQGVEP